MNTFQTGRISRWLIAANLFFAMSCSFQSEPADLIVHNAVIYSINDEFTVYEAMAIREGKIVELGPERQILNKYKSTRIIDAGMKPVYPGFIDAHSHFLGYAMSLRNANLLGTSSWQEVVDRAKTHYDEHRPEWLTGRGWDQNHWELKEFPDKHLLDSLFPDVPVMLKRIDGHAALCNSKALQLAGITADTEVSGGEVLKRNGELTGMLIDNAMGLVDAVIPEENNGVKQAALKLAEANCFEKGLTSVCDAGLMHGDIQLLDQLHSQGDLKMKVYAMITDDPANYSYFTENGPIQTERLTAIAFKYYADGALGSRGACLIEPYSDAPGYHGLMLNSPEYFREKAQWCFDNDFQVCTHAIGDSANRIMLDIYGEVLGGLNDRRWRIEHAQVVHPDDLDKFRKFAVIPSIQPTHATSDMHWAVERLGDGRVETAYAWKNLLNQLQFIPLGTDFPIEDIDPIKTFYSAVFRKDAEGYPEGGYFMDNALSREEALKGITIWAALANFEDKYKGSLEPGKDADFVILDRDILKVSEEHVAMTRCVLTVLSGEEVFSQP